MTTDLAIRQHNGDAMDAVQSWVHLPHDERRRRLVRAIGQLVHPEARQTILGALAAHQYATSRRATRTSPHTITAYTTGARQLLAWTVANGCTLHRLTAEQANAWRAELSASYAPASCNQRLAAARALWRMLADWVGVDAHPFDGLTVRDPVPRHEKASVYMRQDIERLLRAAGDPWTQVLVLLGADAGLRVSEVHRLAWSDVNLAARAAVVAHGKGGRRRTVPLTQRLTDALVALRPANATDDAPVMGVCSLRRLQRSLARLCDTAGVEHLGYHALRHRAGTALHRASGGNLLVVASMLGHSHLDTTRVYAHLADTELRDAVDALPMAS